MARKKKRSGRVAVTGGVIGLILYFLFSGGDIGLLNNGTNLGNESNEPVVVNEEVVEDNEETSSEMIIEINDNTITLNEKEVNVDKILSELGESKEVILRASNAKQVTYDEVKSLLNDHDIVIIEE